MCPCCGRCGYVCLSHRLKEYAGRELPGCVPGCHLAVAEPQTVLRGDQIGAVRALLNLVHYDDLAQSWLDMLPGELRPQVGAR